MAYDELRQRVVLFGGIGPGNVLLNDTWTYDGTTWAQQTTPTAPPARELAAMVWDPLRGNVVLFSGFGAGTDTWIWDGSTWSQRTPATSPPGRYWASAAFDSANGRVTVFGGTNGSAVYNDTWTWDGTTWARRVTAAAPSPRIGPAMAYEAGSDKVVLFGGSPFSCGNLSCPAAPAGDTWSFDGTNWTQAQPSASPPARSSAAMAYDPALGGIILFGGYNFDGSGNVVLLNDTWLWDGSGWADAGLIGSPPGRAYTAMAFDGATGQLLVFGGYNSQNNFLGDTWSYDTAVPTSTYTVEPAPDPACDCYAKGQVVRYTTSLGNAGSSPIDDVSLTATNGDGAGLLQTVGSLLQVVGTTTSDLVCAVGLPTPPGTTGCTIDANTGGLSLSGATVPVGSLLELAYDVVATGLDAACSEIVNTLLASIPLGSGLPLTSSITVCDVGLGMESWWSYVDRDLGSGAVASVNVSNGNLVVRDTDSTPVQAHGSLDYTFSRTYNSADTTILTGRSVLGAGWTMNVSRSGDLAGVGLTSDGLALPSAESLVRSVVNPLGLTFVDRDGTRHVFRTNGINLDLPVLRVVNGQPSGLLSGALAGLLPRVLSLDVAQYTNLCVDVTYTAPPGLHIGLSRYVAVAALPGSTNPCAVTARDPNGADAVTVGFVAERPDRLRYEFDAAGRLLDMVDPNGVDMRYLYDDPHGRLTTVYEPRSCTDPATPTCRAFRLDYSFERETRVTDPAGRTTRYLFDSTSPATRHLMEVVNPDGTRDLYTYQGVTYAGVTGACAGASPGQLCTVKDHSGKQTSFTYHGGFLGPARLATLRDRRGTETKFSYASATQAFTSVDIAGAQWVQFSGIDSAGRVAKIDEGGGSAPAVRTTELTWDTPSATCRQPDARVDNNLCRQVRRSYALAYAPDEDTSYLYNPEGRTLRVRQANPGGALDTTFGYRSSYVQVDGTVQAFDDVVAGSGVVNSSGPSTGRAGAASLFALSDQSQSLTPRGNAAGNGSGDYLTTYRVDNNPAVRPNAIPSAPTCTDADHPTANTGNLCEVVAPSADGLGESARSGFLR